MPKHKEDADRQVRRSEEDIPLYCGNCYRVLWFASPHQDELEGGLMIKECWECGQEQKYHQPPEPVPDDTVMLTDTLSPLSKAEVEQLDTEATQTEEVTDEQEDYEFSF